MEGFLPIAFTEMTKDASIASTEMAKDGGTSVAVSGAIRVSLSLGLRLLPGTTEMAGLSHDTVSPSDEATAHPCCALLPLPCLIGHSHYLLPPFAVLEGTDAHPLSLTVMHLESPFYRSQQS